MIGEWLATAFAGGYLALVAFGHVCVAAAIYHCLRSDPVDGRRRRELAPDLAAATQAPTALRPQLS